MHLLNLELLMLHLLLVILIKVILIMGGRRKNPHPKRAGSVKTVLKGDEKEERGRGEEKEGDEELRLLRMLRCGSP